MRIVHMTSAHHRDDVRIFKKMCASLSKRHAVTLIVADGLGGEVDSPVEIVDVGREAGRALRITKTPGRIFSAARKLNADVYHFHDPELLWVGAKLSKLGYFTIYDAHEDLGRDVLSKHYIPALLRPPIAALSEVIEKSLSTRCDHVVAATPTIEAKFKRWGTDATAINNFPHLASWLPRDRSPVVGQISYIGGIAESRGIIPLVQAMDHCLPVVQLMLAGEFCDDGTYSRACSMVGWERVKYCGSISLPEVGQLLVNSVCGICTLLPTPAYVQALPVKMFEYMAAGIPIIASDFPLWRSIFEDAKCGLLVDPTNPVDIADAINWIVTHPHEASEMGENGRRAAQEIYNWDREERKLLKLYDDIAGPQRERN